MDRIGGDVRRELARLGPSAGLGELASAWPGAVGEAIARNAWPARIARDGTLHVATSSSAWAFELGHLAPEIARRLRESLGEAAPARLRFAPGPLPEPGAPETPAAAGPPDPPAEVRAQADALAAGIDDAELRERVARVAARSLVQGSAGRRF